MPTALPRVLLHPVPVCPKDAWSGSIGKVAVYNGALPASRVQAHFSAGSGYFARIEYREAPGVRIQGRAPTIEDVADNIDKIADLSVSKVYRTSSEEVAAVVGA